MRPAFPFLSWLPVLSLLALPATGAAEGGRPGELRHSGTVVEVASDGSRVTMEEMVAWTGPGTGVVRREVGLTPGTSVQLVVRDEEPSRPALTGFKETPIQLAELRPGDFVTLTTRELDGRATAVSIEVIRPDDAGSASPR